MSDPRPVSNHDVCFTSPSIPTDTLSEQGFERITGVLDEGQCEALTHALGPVDGEHRRVLHIEYAGFPLPAALEWHEHL